MYTQKNIICIGFTVLGLLLSISAFSQRYFPGFVVTLNGDTLKGLVHHEDDSRKILFKQNKESARSVFSPMDIRSYGVRDELYESAIVKIEESPENETTLSETGELELETDTLFLEVLVRGPKSLYSGFSKLLKQQFYIGQDTAFELLIYKKYTKVVQERKGIVENRRFIGQLANYLKDRPSMIEKIQQAKYQERSLQEIMRLYYTSATSRYSYAKSLHRIPKEFGILAGGSVSSLKFRYTGPGLNPLTTLDLSKSTDFTGGIYLGFVFPRNQGRWSVFNELQFTQYRVTAYTSEYVSPDYYTNTTYTLGYTYIRLNNMLRYRIPVAAKSAMFFNLGISSGLSVDERNSKNRESRVYTSTIYDTDPAVTGVRKYEQAIFLGSGFKAKRFSIEARFEKSNGFSDLRNLTSTATRYFLLLGYRF